MQPALSILTPVFRGADRIEACIANVAAEKLAGIEHLILDNASDDGTAEVAARLAEKWPHVRVISEPDQGQSDAMNKGLALAMGDVVGFLNVDDWYEPGTLRRAVEIFEKSPKPLLLIGNCAVHDQSGSVTGINRPDRSSLSDWLAGKPYPWNPSAYFYHRSVHDHVGSYDVNDHYLMDLDFLLRAAGAVDIQYVDELFGHFYFGPGTKTYGLGAELFARVDAMRKQHLSRQPLLVRAHVACVESSQWIQNRLKRVSQRWRVRRK